MAQDRERKPHTCSALVIASDGKIPQVFCRRTGISGEGSQDRRMLEACPFNREQKVPQVSDCRKLG